MIIRPPRKWNVWNLNIAARVIVVILIAAPARSQSPAARPAQAFEVASITPAVALAGGEGSSRSRIDLSPNSLTMRNIDLAEMVQWAYGVQPFQVVGQGVLRDRRYDIRATAGDSVSVAQQRIMLQDLLESRFKLIVHRQPKKTPVYELVIAKGGSRLPVSKADLPASHSKESLPRVIDGGFVFLNTSVTEFAEQLSHLRGIDKPVVDRTGIQGIFDITLKSAASAMLQADGPSLFTLIQEQLGLKLVGASALMEFLVIDSAEPPSGN
jgi:uncharacterized protein (TIGR03435 family)